MNVLILSGSRNPDGQTASALKALADGVQSKGGTVDIVWLPELNLERCRQCELDGWGDCRVKGTCIIEDDFAGLTDRCAAADVVVFATPVYFGDLAESLRGFTDRLRRITRYESVAAKFQGKRALAVCVAGGRGGGSQHCGMQIDKILGAMGFDLIDTVLCRRQNLDLKLGVLRLTGEWLASN